MEHHFGELTGRMQEFRAVLLKTKPYICAERAILTTESYKEYQHQPLALKRAYMLRNILEHMTIFIEPQTILVGNQASGNRSAPIFPEYAMDWVINELDEFEKRDGDIFYITEKTKEELHSIAPYWKNNTICERGLARMPESTRLYHELGLIDVEGKITSGDAHLAVDYARLLAHGLREVKERAENKMKTLNFTDYRNLKKSYFYRAIVIVVDAVHDFALRYANLADEMASTENDEKRKLELSEISRILRKVPYEKADTFQEALQSVWLVHLVLQIESNGHSLSYGRADQFFYPYYEKDLKEGRLTEKSACEMLTNLWLKTYTINKVRNGAHTKFSAGSPLYQNVTIGGQTKDKKDAVNSLSYLILRSVAQTKLPQPNLTVRYHKGLKDDFMKECIEVVRLGTGMPAFNSDEIIIPSFIEKGVSEEDAYNYSAIGCVEVAVPGRWGYRCTGMSFLNFPRSFMIALNDGVDVETKQRLCEGTGHFTKMTSFDQVMAAWDKIVREFCRQCVTIDACCDMTQEESTMDVLCSALTDDCIERGLSLKEGGAVYDFISGLQVGIANLGDAMAGIKKCVFEDKAFTPQELWEALLSNYAGKKGKKIQQTLLAAPKYGNDDDYVDLLIREAYDIYIDELSHYHNTRYGRGPIGGCYYAGTSSISANVPQGASTMATPDGRNAHDPLAEGCSPSHGMDKKGPTAVFKTVAKLPTSKITGGVLLNQKMTPQLLAKEENRMKLIMLLRTFFNRLKGFHVQYNVVARETLIDAQKNPDKHSDLIVRVAGYSAFFNVLSHQTQNDIIERTEQSL